MTRVSPSTMVASLACAVDTDSTARSRGGNPAYAILPRLNNGSACSSKATSRFGLPNKIFCPSAAVPLDFSACTSRLERVGLVTI